MEILKYIAIAALTPIISAGVYLGSFFQGEAPVVPTVGATIPTAVALYEDTLASSISSSDTSFTLARGTDKTGRSLASSTYGFIIDEGSANEEMVLANCTYRTCTGAIRGIDPLYGTSTTASLQKNHRRGASIKITDGPQLITISRILNGSETVPNVLEYQTAPTFTSNNQIVSKLYVDGVTTAGAPDAGTATKGIARLSTAAASSTLPIVVGDNDTRVPTQSENDALVGTSGSPSSSNLFVTANDNTRNYGSIAYASSTAGSDTYAITLSPALTSYATGTEVAFRADVANTGAATLNVNALGAKDLVVGTATPLVTGNIFASQIVKSVYNGTSFTVLNPQTVLPTFASTTVNFSTSTTGTTDDDTGVVTIVLTKASRVLLNCECYSRYSNTNVQNKTTTYSFNVNNDTYIWGSVIRHEDAPALASTLPLTMSYITPELPAGTYTFRMRIVLSSVSNYTMSVVGELQALVLTQ